MKYRICNNKKGIGIDDALAAVFVIFFAAIFLAGFKIYDKIKSEEKINGVKSQKDILRGHEILMGYLAKIDEQGNNKAYFIAKSYAEKDYEVLRKDMEKYFSAKLSHLPAWYIDIVGPSKDVIFSLQSSNLPFGRDTYVVDVFEPTASAFIPINEAEPQYLSIKLFFGKII